MHLCVNRTLNSLYCFVQTRTIIFAIFFLASGVLFQKRRIKDHAMFILKVANFLNVVTFVRKVYRAKKSVSVVFKLCRIQSKIECVRIKRGILFSEDEFNFAFYPSFPFRDLATWKNVM